MIARQGKPRNLFEQFLYEHYGKDMLRQFREGTHQHRCDDCGYVWEHLDPTLEVSDEEYKRRHCCERCGREQRQKYRPKKERVQRAA